MGNEFKSFICYRKATKDTTDHPYYMSTNVAGLLHHLISNSDKNSLKNASPALFQEGSAPDVQWAENGIKNNVPHCDYFFIVLCPDFFDPLISQYRAELTKGLSEEDARKNIVGRISSHDSDVPISCLELLYAMSNDHIQICPINVSYGNGNEKRYFTWKNSDIALLAAVFEKLCHERELRTDKDLYVFFENKFHALFSSVNSPEINYAHVEHWLHGFNWLPQESEQPQSIPFECLNTPAVQALVNSLCLFLKPIPPHEVIQKLYLEGSLERHLSACAAVTYKASIPRRNQRSGEVPKDKKYSAVDDDIIYDPLPANPSYAYPRLPYSVIRNYRNLCNSVGIPHESNAADLQLYTDEFAYWPIDLHSPESKEIDSIHVCGVCFGTLIAFHRLTKDVRRDKVNEKYVSTIQHGLNLLIALRNPRTPNWPSQWKIQNGVADVTGTINQTTLSLSTLLSCGFLSYHDTSSEAPNEKKMDTIFGSADREHLKMRHRFIKESIDYLLDSRGDNDTLGWSYTVDSGLDDAVLPTVFVFNALVKYHKCLQDLIGVFSNDFDYHQQLIEEMDEISDYINDTIEFYFKTVKNRNGSFYAVMDSEESITHTAYVINSMCTYQEKFPKELQTQEANHILNAASEYLVSELERRSNSSKTANEWNRWLYIKDHERFEDFKFRNKEPEKYEHCAELIVAEALIKILNCQVCNCDKETTKRLLFWLASNYIGKVDYQNSNCIYIRGRRDALYYPIYYIYYYRMFISDFLKLLDDPKKGEKPQ